MHTAMINRIGVDAACSLMVTGSDDKTARLWALPEGGRGSPELLRTLRVPIGDGNDGKIYAVALSPNGKWVAAGGMGRSTEIGIQFTFTFSNAATGRCRHPPRPSRRCDLPSRLLARWQSPSRHAWGGEGMRLWETAGWRLLAEDNNYDGKNSYGAAFDSANRLYTVAYDGQIRRYDAMDVSKRRRLRKAASCPTASPSTPTAQSSPSASTTQSRLRFTTRHAQAALRRRYERY